MATKRESTTDRSVGMIICEGVWRREEVAKAETPEKLMAFVRARPLSTAPAPYERYFHDTSHMPILGRSTQSSSIPGESTNPIS
jgi:hypothetical protein